MTHGPTIGCLVRLRTSGHGIDAVEGHPGVYPASPRPAPRVGPRGGPVALEPADREVRRGGARSHPGADRRPERSVSGPWGTGSLAGGEGRAGLPLAAGGLGRPCHCSPVSSTHRMRCKRRCEPSVPCGPRVGRARGGKRRGGSVGDVCAPRSRTARAAGGCHLLKQVAPNTTIA